MKKHIVLLIILLHSALNFAQKTFTYAQFAVKVEQKKVTRVNLKSHLEAKFYRTNLRRALANSDVNFAGKYILVSWGCGSGCSQGAIINAQTGNVYFPFELQGVYAGGLTLGNHDMLEFKKNSSLLVINGYACGGFNTEKESEHGIYYYQWTGKAFKLLKFIKKEVEIPN